MSVKLLAEHNLEFLSLKGGCTCWSESTHVKMPHCWKSHVMAQISIKYYHIELKLELAYNGLAFSDKFIFFIIPYKPTRVIYSC